MYNLLLKENKLKTSIEEPIIKERTEKDPIPGKKIPWDHSEEVIFY